MTKPLPTHWFLLGLAAAAALPAVYTLDPLLDADTWWHMAVGRWIVENRDVPFFDPFSQLARSTQQHWYAYSWLYDLAIFEHFHLSSYPGLILFRTAICYTSTAAMFAFLAHRGGTKPLTIIMALLTGIVLMMFAKERPWHFTIAATTLTVWVVQFLREGGFFRRSLWLIPLFVLWANIHIQFVYGWCVLLLACGFPGRANRKTLLKLTAACILATLVNPYHFRLIIVIIEYALQTAPREYINELVPPDKNAPSTIAAGALFLIGIATAGRRRPIDAFSLIFLIVSALFACRMRRDLWFVALAAMSALPREPRAIANANVLKQVVGVVAITYLLIRLFDAVQPQIWQDIRSRNENRFPRPLKRPLERLLEREPPPMRLAGNDSFKFGERPATRERYYNHLDMGGWLIWFWPHCPVSIDGRTNLYGDDCIRRSFQTWNCKGDWQSDPEFTAATVIFAPANLPLTKWLMESKEWKVIMSNQNATVFKRVNR